MKEIILKIIDENTYDIESQCGTRYDAINIETDELAELITKALDNFTSSSRIIHSHPKQGHFYWVKDNDDSGYEVAYVRHYFAGCARFEFVSGGMKMQSEISDWKREPLLYKG